MATRKLKVERVDVSEVTHKSKGGATADHPVTQVTITFSRKLTSLEVSGVRAVLDGEIK